MTPRLLRIAAAGTCTFVLLAPGRLHAQGTPRATTVRAFADVSFTSFQASQTFETVFGSSSGLIYGGGIEVIVPQHIGISARFGRYSKSGERVFMYNGERFGLGIPLRAKVTPIMFGADYRFGMKRVSYYAGGDVGAYRYEETSSFADAEENVKSSFLAYGAHGGVHVQISRWFGAGGEVRWITVPGALGDGGVSQEFGEDNLGGVNVALRLTVGRSQGPARKTRPSSPPAPPRDIVDAPSSGRFDTIAGPRRTATVLQTASVYVTPTAWRRLAPLLVATEGTVLDVTGRQDGEWIEVQFEDRQWGRRTGWVQKKDVRISEPR